MAGKLHVLVALVSQSWRLGLHALATMPKRSISAFVLIALLSGLQALTPAPSHVRPALSLLFSLVTLSCLLARLFIEAPLSIGVHRFVLTGEIEDGVSIATSKRQSRFARYNLGVHVYIGFVSILCAIPALIAVWKFHDDKVLAGVIAGAPAATLALFLLMRVAFAFPALAIDHPSPLMQSRTLAYGRRWNMLFVFIAADLPLLAAGYAPWLIAKLVTFPAPLAWAASLVFNAATETLGVAILAAVASLLYQRYVDAGPVQFPLSDRKPSGLRVRQAV